MNRQVSYIIQGFLLALLIPITGFIVMKISSVKSVEKNARTVIDEAPRKEPALVGNISMGKTLFMQKCATCHHLFKDGTGPSLANFEERGPWTERKNLYAWIKNPPAFMKNNSYTRDLKKKYSSVMTALPDITNEEIDAIAEYINQKVIP